jgi:Phytanoyl-CoA dioxygenase (PhyH)
LSRRISNQESISFSQDDQFERDPLVTIEVALDPATQSTGCMDCIPESHVFTACGRRSDTGGAIFGSCRVLPDAWLPAVDCGGVWGEGEVQQGNPFTPCLNCIRPSLVDLL